MRLSRLASSSTRATGVSLRTVQSRAAKVQLRNSAATAQAASARSATPVLPSSGNANSESTDTSSSSSNSAAQSNRTQLVQKPSAGGLRLNPILDGLFQPREEIKLESRPWGPKSRRVGVIARKREQRLATAWQRLLTVVVGMISLWDHWGRMLPLTVLRVRDAHARGATQRVIATTQLESCQVLQIKEGLRKNGDVSIQLGASYKKIKRTNKSQMVHFNRAGVLPKAKVHAAAAAIHHLNWNCIADGRVSLHSRRCAACRMDADCASFRARPVR